MFIAVLIVLFCLAYVSKRRFGMLGLALIAGATLSRLWADTLTPYFARVGVTLEQPPLAIVVAAGLVLLPALLLLLGGPVYHTSRSRLIASLLFAILAATLVVEPLAKSFVLVGFDRDVYRVLTEYQVYIVTAGIIAALFDVLGVHAGGGKHRAKH